MKRITKTEHIAINILRIAFILFVLFLGFASYGQTTTFNNVSKWNIDKKQFDEPISQVNIVSIDRTNKRVKVNNNQVFFVQRFLDQRGIFIIDCRDSLTKEECSIEFKEKGKAVQFDFLNRRYIFKQ